MKNLKNAGVGCLIVFLVGCGTIIGGKPERFNEDWTWKQMSQYEEIFPTNSEGECMPYCYDVYSEVVFEGEARWEITQVCRDWCALEDRIDYMDAYGRGINAYRGD
jgi:hypothetical protein